MYPKTFSGLPAVQVDEEFRGLLDLIRQNDVKSYLEVGVGRGDTFHEVMLNLPKGSTGVTLDLPNASWGFAEGRECLERAANDLRAKYKIHTYFGNSRNSGMKNLVGQHAPFDLAFIDGDHTLEGVVADFENYGSLARIVVFHDIVDTMRPNLRNEVIDVPLFWQAIKKRYRHIEFIGNKSTMGIGVIFKC